MSFDGGIPFGEGLNAKVRGILLPFLSRERIVRPDVKYETHAFILPETEYSQRNSSPVESLSNQCTRRCCIDRLSRHDSPVPSELTPLEYQGIFSGTSL